MWRGGVCGGSVGGCEYRLVIRDSESPQIVQLFCCLDVIQRIYYISLSLG